MPPPLESLLLALSLYVQMISGDQCSGGSNIFTEIQENSPSGTFVANLSVFGDPVTSTVKLCLSGTDAGWFYLDGKNIWLNVSSGKTLDKEALNSSVLLVTLTCSEEGFPAVHYRIIVQVLNQNDNMPTFLEESVNAQNISELTEVDSVVFTAQAMDLDGDILMYLIDQTTGDFKYFHMDLPSNGKVLLSRPLDYESKQELEVVVHALEISTREHYRTSARVRITVLDGDDQYPYFLPCSYMPHDGVNVCVSPTYRANITVGQEQTGPLVFSPGPIIAEDGDRGILAPISYSFLSGPDNEMFQIDNVTGSISLSVELSSSSSVLVLKVMASQVGDPRKYAIAEVEIRVLASNHHAPFFGSTEYQAFVQEDPSPAALVKTYSGKLLSLMPSDGDFHNGTNPHVRLSLSSLSNHSQLFQITQGGLLIARTNQLQATKRYLLQVIARDEESGEAANCSVVVNVLAYGQSAPLDPSEPRLMFTVPDLPIVAGGLGALVILFGVLLFFLIWALRGHRQQQQQRSRTSLVTEKHPSVSLQWFHTAEEQGYQNAAYMESPGEENISQERSPVHPLTGQATKKESSTADGHPGKQQQKKAPAVAVISPGNQCVGRSPFKNGEDKEADSLNAIPHRHLAAEKDLHSGKVGITQALVTSEQEESQPPKSSPVESYILHPPSPQPSNPEACKEIAEKDDAVLWPDPPVLSRLPVVVEVNEEAVEREGDQTEQRPPMGSEIITPGSLMQLLEDSIEC
ncbi:cadherin-related family member 5-like isoform X1 [Xenopus laevis]|uniref:Cadherin-related family member 5-like isoform X1 n=1 Tax=Xenopus laevis TaxID=8355 RepID=A0A8J1ML98_XENLA|nr:cadherin-related family member 5-like isoform X1 [Xenopus laevis]XP_041442545.1 cadherin-related family member 5-like isoform X1 [Xenopus laevis]